MRNQKSKGTIRESRFQLTLRAHYTEKEMNQNQQPTAPRKHTELQLHGILLTDDYAWLREKENPEVIAYLDR